MVRLTEEQNRQLEHEYAQEIQKLVSDVLFRRKSRGFSGKRLTRIADRLRELSEDYVSATTSVGIDNIQVAYSDLMDGLRDRVGDAEAEPLQHQLDYATILHALTPDELRDKSV